jgi:hypothetical protein
MHGINLGAYLPAASPAAVFGQPYGLEIMNALIPYSHTVSRQALLNILGANPKRKLVLSESTSRQGAINLFLMDIKDGEHQVVAARVAMDLELPGLDVLSYVAWHTCAFPSADLSFLAYKQATIAGQFEYSW